MQTAIKHMVCNVNVVMAIFSMVLALHILIAFVSHWPHLPFGHSGLQQAARPHLLVSEGDEKWSDSKTVKMSDGHKAAIFSIKTQ